MKKRRIPLSVAILVPLFFAILLGEVGLYLGAYFVLTDTVSQNARTDDQNDFLSLDETLSKENYRLLGYAITPVAYKYETIKPTAPYKPGSQEESDYMAVMSNAAAQQLYASLQNILARYITTFVGIYYEDVASNRMVLVASSNPLFNGSAQEDGAKQPTTYPIPRDGEISSAFLGAFFTRPAAFLQPAESDRPCFYGETLNDVAIGSTFVSATYLAEVKHPNQPYGPYRVWLVRETATSQLFDSLPRFTRNFAIISVAILVVLLAITYLMLRLIFLKPVEKLSGFGKEYVKSLEAGEAKDVFAPNVSRRNNEMTDLNDTLYYTQEAIREYAHKIHDAAAYEEKMKADLAFAERIQMGMLPDAPLFAGNCAVHGYIRPAREVGGDMYNYFQIDDERVAFFVGDVSGKGVSAALFMAKTEALLHLMAPELDINRVNALLCQGNEEFLFVTAFIGVLNFKTGLLRFVNCGHEPVFIFHDGEYSALNEETNMALGCLDDVDFSIQERQLSFGDRLFVYTDGVSEAMDKDGNMFGKQRILDTLNSAVELSGEDRLLQMQNAISEFVQGAEQSDDICMVNLGYIREQAISFPPTMDGLEAVPPFVDEFFKDDPEPFRATINIVLDELCSNVVKYGGVEGTPIRLELRDDGKSIYGTIIDAGIPFDPTTGPREHDPDEPGGLGILVVIEMTNGLKYRRIGDRNILLFKKDR